MRLVIATLLAFAVVGCAQSTAQDTDANPPTVVNQEGPQRPIDPALVAAECIEGWRVSAATVSTLLVRVPVGIDHTAYAVTPDRMQYILVEGDRCEPIPTLPEDALLRRATVYTDYFSEDRYELRELQLEDGGLVYMASVSLSSTWGREEQYAPTVPFCM